MPRNAANNSNTEAECLPNKLTTTTTITPETETTTTAQSKEQESSQQHELKEDTKIIKIITRRIENSPQHLKYCEANYRYCRTTSVSPSTSTSVNKKRSAEGIIIDSDCPIKYSPLYPAVIDLTGGGDGGGGNSIVHALASKAPIKAQLPSSLSVSIITPNVAASCTTPSSRKIPSVVKRKKKSSRYKNSTRNSSRIASLRERKNPITVAASINKKPSPTQKEPPSSVPEALFPHLNPLEFNRIDVLEFDESKSGAGTSGGTKRKRNNSLTSASLTVTTRKRATTVKNIPIPIPIPIAIHTVEPKGVSGGGSGGNTANNMSLYDRRYQAAAAAAAAAATQADDGGGGGVGGRIGGASNGYLSSTRSSSASSGVLHASSIDASLTDVPMETQYYLTTGGGGTSTVSSTLISGIPLSNGGGGGLGGATTTTTATATTATSVSTINHAPSMATLCNIGNSCYLNSVVYTLRFAPRFLHNLHHLVVDLATVQQNIVRHRAKTASLGRGINAVQLENSARCWSSKDLASMEQYNSIATTTGTSAQSSGGNGNGNACGVEICKSRHQLLTENLHELFQSLHRNEIAESTEPHHADKLLHAIQDVNAIFEGNQQQDAHEFLMCVLNSIRETCQTLIKTIADCPELISEGNIIQTDETDANDRDLTAAGIIMNANAPLTASSTQSSSLSTSNFTKTSFFSRKSKRKEEAKSAKNFRLQSPLKDVASGSQQQQQQQQQQQTIANSHFYLNSVDLSSAAATTTNTATSPTSSSATATNCIDKLTNSACSDTIDLSATNPLAKQRLAEKIRELGLDFFSEDFEGITVATTKCLSCETITEQKESMIDIAVPVPISGYDSSDYTEKPSAFIQNSCITREYFRGENKYRCEQCTGYTEAIRSISYEVLPRLLVIQLSRFSGGMEKINSYIPTSFTLQCFCSKCCELSDANKLHIYKLYSVITHVGATMSVGHYIAYTCSLDWVNEFVNCPKDRRTTTGVSKTIQLQQQPPNGIIPQMREAGNNNNNSNNNASVVTSTQTASAASAAASALASSGTSLMKKMKFGRSKASSSGDISKNLKNLNGITNAAAAAAAAAAASANSQSITNGISKLSMNTTCHSLNCCATRLSTVQHHHQQQQQQQYNLNDLSEESMQNGANHIAVAASHPSSFVGSYASYSSGYGSTGRGGTKATPFAASSNGTEPIWYMCDDDKIKAMTQREFEELLSPSRKITITPYLLFYARFDLQQTTTSATSSSAQQTTTTTTTTPPSQKSQCGTMSWSDESLQGGNSGGLKKI